ncbi:uncharacterized protein [Battus philenor]|uniref:uncharacterized protein n=1 Tax=Battus philenor TaxID=42288 RepID=UPI0035CE9F88
MRQYIQTVFFLIVILFAVSALEYQTDIKAAFGNVNYEEDQLMREKRQLENFDSDDTTLAEQEEPGFWDRVVKVALRLFNKFIEWLNSA